MNKSIDFITRTKTKETTHKACVCVICDCFIIGIEPICWLTTEQLKTKESILSVEYYESSTSKKLSKQLRNQYRLSYTTDLANLLLSPRATELNGSYMACESCHRHLSYVTSEAAPKFALSNEWCIGEIPKN